MKKLTVLGSAIALAGGWQLANAQAPGGGGFAQPTFDALNTETEESPEHLTEAEVTAWIEQRMAAFGGGTGGGRGAGGGQAGDGEPGDDASGADGGGRGAPGGRGFGGRGGGGMAGMFGRWDADSDGKITREEFDARPRGGRFGGGSGGRGGGGGGGGQGGGGQQQ